MADGKVNFHARGGGVRHVTPAVTLNTYAGQS
jgi:hypothetical protein